MSHAVQRRAGARPARAATLAAAVAIAAAPTGPRAAGDERVGAEEYRVHCASCHGDEGRGDGPAAEASGPAPGNLRTLAARNGGEFPADRIARVIDGRQPVAGHGTRAMPVWGRRYRAEAAESRDASDAESVVRERISQVVRYLRGLQEP